MVREAVDDFWSYGRTALAPSSPTRADMLRRVKHYRSLTGPVVKAGGEAIQPIRRARLTQVGLGNAVQA